MEVPWVSQDGEWRPVFRSFPSAADISVICFLTAVTHRASGSSDNVSTPLYILMLSGSSETWNFLIENFKK